MPGPTPTHQQPLSTVMEAVTDGLLTATEAGRSATVTVLTAAGVPATTAGELVTRVNEEP
jgi:hypothetical protein